MPIENPQSKVRFAGPGIMIDDPDSIPAYVLNYTLGGGGFHSRLMKEVRVNRGLTYGVYSFTTNHKKTAFFGGQIASDNEKVAEAIEVIKQEIDRIKAEGVTEGELSDAKTYLTGAFVLRFDSNAKIAGQLLGYQILGLGIDYINDRNGMVSAVTMNDIKRVAERLPSSDELQFVVVGQPVGLDGGVSEPVEPAPAP